MTATTDNELPFRVVLNLHVPGRGYSLSVQTDHAEMQVYVSEKGHVIRGYKTVKARKRRSA